MPEDSLAFELTPNPLARRLAWETGLLETISWRGAEAAPPLARAVFGVSGVVEVAAGPGFLTVRLEGPESWSDPDFCASVLATVLQARRLGLDLGDEGASASVLADHDPADAEAVVQIQHLIEERLRPSVEADGGEIVLISFRDGVARIALRGACSGCPSSSRTLRMGVERLLRHYVREVLRVEAV